MGLGQFSKVKLTKQQEAALVVRAQAGCQCGGNTSIACDACDAQSALVDANLRWLLKLCTDHVNHPNGIAKDFNPEEFMADAITGFCEAIKRFDTHSNIRLITYSKKAIITAMSNSDLITGVIHIPVWMRQLQKNIKTCMAIAAQNGEEITIDYLAKHLNKRKTTIMRALNTVSCDLGLHITDSCISYYDDSVAEYDVYTEAIPCSSRTDIHNISYTDSDSWMAESDAKTLYGYLTDEEKEIVSLKLGIGCEPLTKEQIQKKLRCGRKKLDRIYNEAMQKMREIATSTHCEAGKKRAIP